MFPLLLVYEISATRTDEYRCYHLARLHCLHPTPTYSSAVQLLERCHQLISTSKTALLDPSFPLQEEIIKLPESSLTDLEARIKSLDLAAKQALFAERMPKPVFFDNAFNYIDLPMDELMIKAGRQPAETAPKVQAAETVAATVVHQVEKAAGEVKNVVVGRERTREATPATEAQGEKPKGWLGGWFGRS